MSSILYQTFYMNNKFDDPCTIANLNQWMILKRHPSELSTRTTIYDSPSILSCDDKPSPDNSRSHVIVPRTVPSSGVLLTPYREQSVNVAEIITDGGISSKVVSKTVVDPRLYIPNRPNTLFWSLYIAYYGEAAYLAIGNKYGNAEIAEKQKIMEFLKENKKILKSLNKKITIGTTQEIMSDLMTNMKTSLLSVIAYAAYYKRNILLLNTINKTCIEHVYRRTPNLGTCGGARLLSGDGLSSQDNSTDITTPWIVIKYTDAKKYGVLLGENIYDITPFIVDQYTHIETYDKPLKGISTYKLKDLLEISAKIKFADTAITPELGTVRGTVRGLSGDELSSQDKETSATTDTIGVCSAIVAKPIIKSELYGKIWQYCLWN